MELVRELLHEAWERKSGGDSSRDELAAEDYTATSSAVFGVAPVTAGPPGAETLSMKTPRGPSQWPMGQRARLAGAPGAADRRPTEPLDETNKYR